jgi:hypothetical protein
MALLNWCSVCAASSAAMVSRGAGNGLRHFDYFGQNTVFLGFHDASIIDECANA